MTSDPRKDQDQDRDQDQDQDLRPARAFRLAERARASPYYPALTHPVFRRILPGAAASALGDGMSAVAIAWLALKLAPADTRGLWVGAAVAAYSLPGAVGAVALRRWLGGRGGARLVFVNAVLRAVALGLIACLALTGRLDPAGYVALPRRAWHPAGLRARDDRPRPDHRGGACPRQGRGR